MRHVLALALFALSTACKEPAEPEARVDPVGRWSAERIVVGTAPDTVNLIGTGAYLILEIRADGTTSGGYLNSEQAQGRPLWPDARLDGTWSAASRDTIMLKHEESSPIRGVPLVLSDGQLEGSGLVDGQWVSIVLFKEPDAGEVTPR